MALGEFPNAAKSPRRCASAPFHEGGGKMCATPIRGDYDGTFSGGPSSTPAHKNIRKI